MGMVNVSHKGGDQYPQVGTVKKVSGSSSDPNSNSLSLTSAMFWIDAGFVLESGKTYVLDVEYTVSTAANGADPVRKVANMFFGDTGSYGGYGATAGSYGYPTTFVYNTTAVEGYSGVIRMQFSSGSGSGARYAISWNGAIRECPFEHTK